MNGTHSSHKPDKVSTRHGRINKWIFVFAIAFIAGLIILSLTTPHKNHVIDSLPYLLIAVMLFMHLGGHNHGGSKR